jgi:hypothetical protein
MAENTPDDRPNYKPLLIIITVILLTTIALQLGAGTFHAMQMMQHGMGLFFILFSLFKLINIAGFVKGFRMYDILAKRVPAYGKAYPFIELLLGLAYMGNIFPIATNAITLVIMVISSVGVIGSIRRGMNLKCACLGTMLNVPLSTVSIIENVGMGAMALVMLLVLI